jgi:glycosyltransferase involved in cell wall biosynthesis
VRRPRRPRPPEGAPLGVLHLTHQGEDAGSTFSILELARAQRGAGDRVLLGCRPGSLLGALGSADGMEVVPVDFRRIGPAAAGIARLVADRGVDVVNSHASRDRAACRRARLAGRLPVALVMTRRQQPRSLAPSVVVNGLAADCTIAVSASVRRALVRRGAVPWRVRVVPNGIDPARMDRPVEPAALAEARAASAWSADRPTIGVVSRRKAQDVLLRALPLLPRPATVVLLGVGPDAEWRALADAAPAHRVAFVPFRRDVLPFLALFDVVVLPTAGEGLPRALLEAMALGIPVVASRVGGTVDLVTDGVDGVLVPPRAPAAFARALAALLADPGRRAALGSAGRRTVREHFTLDRTRRLTDAAYRDALERRA